MEVLGQLSGQMVETVGEEPEPESEGFPEQREKEVEGEEKLTKVSPVDLGLRD